MPQEHLLVSPVHKRNVVKGTQYEIQACFGFRQLSDAHSKALN
jgi:hypothetical protein